MTEDTTQTSDPGFSCAGREDGNYRDPDNCEQYYACGGGILYVMPCANGHDGRPLFYREDIDACDYRENVPECNA
jgi:hypothetical protein